MNSGLAASEFHSESLRRSHNVVVVVEVVRTMAPSVVDAAAAKQTKPNQTNGSTEVR